MAEPANDRPPAGAPFKNQVGPDAIRSLSARIRSVYPEFPSSSFEVAAEAGLGPMALKERVAHVADCLRKRLPAQWPEAVGVLCASLPPASPAEFGQLGGLEFWPVLSVVERHGHQDPTHSLPALREMTGRFSAEFAIRPFLRRWPDATWAALSAWVSNRDPHVRRLVSEGSRPRLPWGLRLDPDPRALPLLHQLVDDPNEYVRRSVANHLGDLGKLDADATVALAAEWLRERPNRAPLLRHALRDLLKRGHPGALALVGVPPAAVSVTGLAVDDVALGEVATVRAEIKAMEAASLRVDYAWAWPGARSGWCSKTFRGADRQLERGEVWSFRARLHTRPVSTRPGRPGPQRLTLRVSGQDFGPVDWTLLAPRASG